MLEHAEKIWKHSVNNMLDLVSKTCIIVICTRDVAQSGSASALGAEGPRFESLYPDHEFEDCGINSVVE